MDDLQRIDPEVARLISEEERRQESEINLIASENTVSRAVLAAQGSVLTNKYAEGYPGRRYYGGCEVVDRAERLARKRVCALFNAEHANVQAHSGTQANVAAYNALVKPGGRILAMDLAHGGHLSHGAKVSVTGKIFKFRHYPLDRETERIDPRVVAEMARDFRPDLIIAGASAYPRFIDFEAFAALAKEVGAFLLVDMAHIAGLVAAQVHPSPVPHADVVTSTTHKTLRGPRGGLILCREEHAKSIDSAVFPGSQGGPLMHLIAARAVCFQEAATQEFRHYGKQVVENARRLGEVLREAGHRLVSGGTDNHLVLVDVRGRGLTGDVAETALARAGIVVNMNMIPYDPNPPRRPSGLRLGTPSVTSRGMGLTEVEQIGRWIAQVLDDPENRPLAQSIEVEVRALCERFPVFRPRS